MNFLPLSKKKQKKQAEVIMIGFTVQDLDLLLKILQAEKQRAAEQLHQFAIQSNQQGQGRAIQHFKECSNLYEYIKDRLEQKLNLAPGSYDDEDVL
jgi:hypothetical protein